MCKHERKQTLAILLIILLCLVVIAPLAAIASTITSAKYVSTVRITNNSTAAAPVLVPFSYNTSAAISSNYTLPTLLDSSMQSNAAADVAYMPAGPDSSDWMVYVPSIAEKASLDYKLYLGGGVDMGGKIRYFPGNGGMTGADIGSLELGDNWTIEQKGYIDTTQVGANLTYKQDAIRVYIPASGNVSCDISGQSISTNVTSGEHTLGVAMSPLSTSVLELDGVDGVVADTTNALRTTNSTIEFWCQPATQTTADYRSIVIYGNDETDRFTLCLGSGKFVVYDDINDAGDITALTAYIPGTWYYVQVVLDSVNGKSVYVDNVEVLAPNAVTTTLADIGAGAKFWAGSWMGVAGAPSATGYYKGQLSDLRVYSRIVGAVERAEHYNNVFSDNTDLELYWAMDEGAGATINDTSGNSLDGTATGGYSWDTWGKGTLSLIVDGSTVASAFIPYSVNNTANDWTFLSGGSMLHMESHEISINGTQRQFIDWEYTSGNFTDDSGNGHDVVPTYRTTSTDADVSATLLLFEPVNPAVAANWSTGSYGSFIQVPSEPTSMYGELNVAHLPGSDLITDVMAASSTPVEIFWFTVPFLLMIVLGLVVFEFTRSILMQYITMAIIYIGFAAMGPVPLWPVYLFAIMGLAVVVGSQRWSF